MRIATHGPSGLFAEYLSAVAAGAGHELLNEPGCGALPRPEQLAAADVVLLWVGARLASDALCDEMHAVLVALRESDRGAQPRQRVVLVSNLMTWAATPALGAARAGGARLSEDDYAARRCARGAEAQLRLEAHVLRLAGAKFDACVVAAGAAFGCGDESLLALMRGSRAGEAPLRLPQSGDNRVALLHVADLCTFLWHLLALDQMPKPYVIAADAALPQLEDVATALVDHWNAKCYAGALKPDDAEPTAPAAIQPAGSSAPAAIQPAAEPAGGAAPAAEAAVAAPEVKQWRLRADLAALDLGALSAADLSAADLASLAPSVLLTLDLAGLELKTSVFSKAMAESGGAFGGLVKNVGQVCDEYVAARCCAAPRVWVMRPDKAAGLENVAAFLGDELKLPVVTLGDCVQWCAAQAARPAFVAPPPADGAAPADGVVAPLSAEDAALKAAVDAQIAAASPYERALWGLKADLDQAGDAAAGPLADRALRLRLLAPDLRAGYVLDAAPVTPQQLADAFSDASAARQSITSVVDDGAASSLVRVAPGLAPSHVVVVSAGVAEEPELKAWAAQEAAEWRYGGAAPDAGPPKPLAEGVEEVLGVRPTIVRATDVTVAPSSAAADEAPAADEATAGDHAEAPSGESADWRRHLATQLLDTLEATGHGHWGLELALEAPGAAAPDAAAAPAPAPDAAASALPPEEAAPSTAPGSDAPRAKRGEFDEMLRAQFDELHSRSSDLRTYLMANVMVPLTQAMLAVSRLPPGADKVTALADLLDAAADAAEERTEADAKMRFEASVAQLRDLRKVEAEEDAREAEEDAARERGEVL
ncbi:hypothetical protein M885DRAFT_613166 [Pelagophyceae sp. CCMP2097]|nr:hypothetical protein M885DRAFT_613166 [Pelagophyceae sp. CCMP2097]